MNPESAGKTPPWLMKRFLSLFLGSAERTQLLSLLEQNLREHQEVARLDNTYTAYRVTAYREISASVLLMYGGKGHALKTGETMRRPAAVLPRCDMRVFPKLDHFGIDKKAPQEVGRAVGTYLLEAAAPARHRLRWDRM